MLHLKSKYWDQGFAISMYSRAYDRIVGQDFTELGQAIYKYKYHKVLSYDDRKLIEAFCLQKLEGAIRAKLSQETQLAFVVSVPPNRENSYSLPPVMAKALASQSGGAIIDVSNLLVKQKQFPVLKNLDKDEKAKFLLDAFAFSTKLSNSKGALLIIDDIYDTGSTLRSVARAINKTNPELVKYVMTLTALRGNY